MTLSTMRASRGTATRRTHRSAVLAATTLTLLTLAACAAPATHLTAQPGKLPTNPPGTPTNGTPTNGTPTNGTPTKGTPTKTPTSTPTNKQRAEQDAAAIRAAFVAPPGARRLKTAPGVSGGVLTTTTQQPATPNLVDKAGWWQVAGDPKQVLSWVDKHIPGRFTLDGSETESTGKGAANILADTFALPSVPGVLNSRQLIVEVVAAGGGQTDIRVDAQVIWLPPRTPSETLPAGVSAVTLTLGPDMNVHNSPPKPVTVTDAAKVRELVALINGLPTFPAGSYSCPEDGGARLVLTFSAHAGAPASAAATVSLEGCEGVDLVIGGARQPGLGSPDGGRQVAAQALKIVGLSWNLARYLN